MWCPNDLESVSIEEYGYVKMCWSMEMEYECEVLKFTKCTQVQKWKYECKVTKEYLYKGNN